MASILSQYAARLCRSYSSFGACVRATQNHLLDQSSISLEDGASALRPLQVPRLYHGFARLPLFARAALFAR
jgi:hypothetical protein